MNQLLAIVAGGSVGAVARFWVANAVYAWIGRDFPYGTLVVNVSGALCIGLLSEMLLQRFAFSAEARAALMIGFLGAYTTFSTFALETIYLLEAGSWVKAVVNVVASVIFCLLAVWGGILAGRYLTTQLIARCL
ncbi:fluoride efflux transporter CrcB [Candidatus Methylospira mobilis]|uniref:Fluoride-specific ion channel FluC n=1 Tax=Candidatus Methylospira mobilis TaxID=1808979 RepID=A0A5Q0BIG0_9GAMM|nr:fluoride efflux transporter CrcB [Candidatus Methylospira mobilis]